MDVSGSGMSGASGRDSSARRLNSHLEAPQEASAPLTPRLFQSKRREGGRAGVVLTDLSVTCFMCCVELYTCGTTAVAT